jgi:uncharacterized protein YdaU (DUF1376 family)
MNDKLPFMPLYVSDYLADTTHLTCDEHGAYLLLLMAMWKSGGSLPRDDIALARIARLPLPRWKKMSPNVIPFFQAEGAVLCHKRVSAEMANARDVSEARSKAGKRGAEAKRLKRQETASANATAELEQNESKGEPSHTSHFTNITSSSAASTPTPRADRSGHSDPASGPGASESRAALCVSLGKRITDIMGVTGDPRWHGSWSIIQLWMAQGYDPDLDIWPAVAGRVERIKKTGGHMLGGLKYFSPVIAEHHQARIDGVTASTFKSVQSTGVEFTVVNRGTPEYAAWIDHQRRQGKRTKFLESREALSVPAAEIAKLMDRP